MTFDEWYECNKEILTSYILESKLRKAFEAGVQSQSGEVQIQDELARPEPRCAGGRTRGM